MCEHLKQLDDDLQQKGIRETFRGQAWSDNTREWVYYDCILDLEGIQKKYQFPDFVKVHINNDNRSGLEAGFYCEKCQDGVMGHHPSLAGKVKVKL